MQTCYNTNMSTAQIKPPRSNCPINYAVEIIGDKWSLLIVRDIVYAGKRTHGEFMKSEEGIATNILADRLIRLECQEILEKQPDPADKRRDIYSLTEKGLGLIPFLLDLQLWSDAFGPSYISRSAPLAAALKANRDQVITQITDDVRRGGFIFAHPEWLPGHSAK
jgi:DNA-binding HxlR family transcriptional regulator